MKALKTLVIVMGVMLAAGMGLLVWGVASRIGGQGSAPPAKSAAEFGDIPLPLSPGERIDSVGYAADRVIVRVTGTGRDRIIVLDPQKGRIAGSFVATPQTP